MTSSTSEEPSDTFLRTGQAAFVNPFDSAVDQNAAREYEDVRPGYPPETFAEVIRGEGEVAALADRLVAVDIGAGTGRFTHGLVTRGVRTTAVEPSTPMREVLSSQSWAQNAQQRRGSVGPLLRVVAGTGEETGLPDNYADRVVWAQCSHWLDLPRATEEAARILRPAGTLNLVANQLAVDVPWVHRLSRIMRSGDVVRRDRTPDLGSKFLEPTLFETPWEQRLTVDDCLRLARTRSSYLAAKEGQRLKMQENLRWYLVDHLGLDQSRPFRLPYVTMVWSSRVSPR